MVGGLEPSVKKIWADKSVLGVVLETELLRVIDICSILALLTDDSATTDGDHHKTTVESNPTS